MKKVIIDGKEYFQQEDSDIEKLPKMPVDKDILTKYKYNEMKEAIDE